MSPSALEYLRHISDELNYLTRQSKKLNQEDFFKSETLQKAFVRSLEVIGEATKKIPDDFKNKYNQIEWKAIKSNGRQWRLCGINLFTTTSESIMKLFGTL